MKNYNNFDRFETRHIGPGENDLQIMLDAVGTDSIETLISETIPSHIRLEKGIENFDAISELEYIEFLSKTASENIQVKSYIGMGYHPVITPPVIIRNILENPGWYTQYTPYQAEIAQGRLEALINFQTMISDLTGLPIANASLLDEGTAASEAMLMFFHNKNNKNAVKFFVDEDIFPQTYDILVTRAVPKNIEIVKGNFADVKLDETYFAAFIQYPSGNGEVKDYKNFIENAHNSGVLVVAATDLFALTLLTPPGEIGADVVVGSSQRFGVPMGYGGPHAAFFSTTEKFKRVIPGRIIGASTDSQGNLSYRMALQTREQHIRREKATSNICTAQVLLAIMAGMYAVYHGSTGLKNIALRIYSLTALLKAELVKTGFDVLTKNHFDTLTLKIEDSSTLNAIKNGLSNTVNLRYYDDKVGISINETTTINDIFELLSVFAAVKKVTLSRSDFDSAAALLSIEIPKEFERTTSFLTHPVFNSYRSETEFLRYAKKLENKDLSLAHSMIPLGSCTMKLNATTEMVGVTMPGFANIHPFAPSSQVKGYKRVINELESYLSKITGFPGVSLQPNSGAQGEYAGLMVIREYHLSKGDSQRNVVLIPASAHGTNPASAVMAGMDVVVVNCDDHGNIDVEDLKKKAELHKDKLSSLMVTYPSTHGVFEDEIINICEIIHRNGGQVYMDGANMNAQVGLTSPARIGADVCHLNLHKTFAIPHGGGGPGMGPICVASHLIPFLPGHFTFSQGEINGSKQMGAVSAAPYGSALILLISLGYIKMLGSEGITNSTKIAILNANYIKAKLEGYYKTLYTNTKGRVAHELIFDMRDFKRSVNIEVEDIAKRLMDYGFHAPTVSFPVAGTLMVEPTESESLQELVRFCEAMIAIRTEIAEIEKGEYPIDNNVLKNAPHTVGMVVANEWNKPYSREKAAYPITSLKNNKFWPTVGRVNNAAGDRNLVCTCNPVSDYIEN